MSTDTALHLVLLAAYALAAHGVMLLNDGLYWDGWLVDSWQRNRSWPLMRRFYAETGLAQTYYQHRWLAGAPRRLFVYRLVAFASLLLAAIAVYGLAREVSLLTPGECLLLALLFLSYTGYHMNVDTVVGVNYTVPMALFYCAAYLAMLALGEAGLVHWSLRLASLVLFVLAFNANSTLVYYFGFLGLRFALAPGTSFWLGNIDYLVLPFAYWILKNRLTPRHGSYADYNRIRLWSPRLPRSLLDALRFGLESPLIMPFASAVRRHYLWALAATFFAALYAARATGTPSAMAPSMAAEMLLAGGGLFFLAAIPYALVGQSFYPSGWGTKNHLLFHLPVALMVLGGVSLLPSVEIALALIALLLVANAVHLNLAYLHYLAAWVKNRSWLSKLSRMPEAAGISIFLVEDRHSIQGDPSIPSQEHRAAYLFYMFEQVWGDKRRLGIAVVDGVGRRLSADELAAEIAATTLDYDMQQVDLRGAQARVLINDGPAARWLMRVALLYLRERYLPGGRIEPFLERVTDVKLVPL